MSTKTATQLKTKTDPKPLRLKVLGLEDLLVISSILQDGIVYGGGAHFERPKDSQVKTGGTFNLIVERFCWEASAEAFENQTHQRVLSGLQFHHVTSIRHKGFDLKNRYKSYNLLSIEMPTPQTICLTFSAGVKIELTIQTLSCLLGDLNEPWATPVKPAHLD